MVVPRRRRRRVDRDRAARSQAGADHPYRSTPAEPEDRPDADGLYRFEVPTTAERLILRVVASTGGNTGLVEFEAYRAP